MLDSVDAKSFLEWRIADKLGLDPDGWYQMAELASSLTNQFILLRNQMAAVKTRESDLVDPQVFLPSGMK